MRRGQRAISCRNVMTASYRLAKATDRRADEQELRGLMADVVIESLKFAVRLWLVQMGKNRVKVEDL